MFTRTFPWHFVVFGETNWLFRFFSEVLAKEPPIRDVPFWQREHQLNVGTSYKHRGAQRKQNSIATYLKLSGRRKKTSPRRRSHFRQMIFRGTSIWNDEQSQFIALNFDNCTVFNLFGYVNSHFDNTNSIFRFVILKFCLSFYEEK